MKKLEDLFLWQALVKAQRFVLMLCSSIIVIAIVSSVIMRYVIKSDLYGIEEIITLNAMWLYFIGGLYGTYEGSHIEADVLSPLIKSKKTARTMNVILAAISVLCSAVLAQWGIKYMHWGFKLGAKTISLHIPMIASQLPISICFVGMLVFNIYHLVNILLGRQVDVQGNRGEAE